MVPGAGAAGGGRGRRGSGAAAEREARRVGLEVWVAYNRGRGEIVGRPRYTSLVRVG